MSQLTGEKIRKLYGPNFRSVGETAAAAGLSKTTITKYCDDKIVASFRHYRRRIIDIDSAPRGIQVADSKQLPAGATVGRMVLEHDG